MVLPQTACKILEELLNHSKPQFPYMLIGVHNRTYLEGLQGQNATIQPLLSTYSVLNTSIVCTPFALSLQVLPNVCIGNTQSEVLFVLAFFSLKPITIDDANGYYAP